MTSFLQYLKESDPCWKGYRQLGMKMKDGKKVPNCIPDESKGEEQITKPKSMKNETK